MKKVICAVAAFAMVAGLVTVASAEVNLSGSARFRAGVVDRGLLNESGHTSWDSRVRFKVDVKTEGGGYVKSRIRLLDGTWGQGGNYSPTAKGLKNVWSDYAFVGFKAGKFDIAGGKMPVGFSKWWLDDERRDRFRVLFKDGGLALAFTYDVNMYDTVVKTGAALVNDIDGNPILVDSVSLNTDATYDNLDAWGVTYLQKFSDAISAKARVVYVSDGFQSYTPAGIEWDRSGIKGSAGLDMNFGGNKISVEQSWKSGDTVGYDADSQYGGYASWSSTFGTITPTVLAAYTKDGFTADETFGMIMIGGDIIGIVPRLGMGGDTLYFGGSVKMQSSEKLSFQGNLAWLDIEDTMDAEGFHSAVYGENPMELSGQAKYNVGIGVDLLARLGYVKSDGYLDDAIAGYLQTEVSF